MKNNEFYCYYRPDGNFVDLTGTSDKNLLVEMKKFLNDIKSKKSKDSEFLLVLLSNFDENISLSIRGEMHLVKPHNKLFALPYHLFKPSIFPTSQDFSNGSFCFLPKHRIEEVLSLVKQPPKYKLDLDYLIENIEKQTLSFQIPKLLGYYSDLTEKIDYMQDSTGNLDLVKLEYDHIMSLFLQEFIFQTILKIHAEKQKGPIINLAQASSGLEYYKRAEIAKQYIDDNIDKPITIQELCQISSMSKSLFFNIFKELYRMSPRQYIIKLRIDKAKSLLRNKKLSLDEISLDCGFDTPANFYRFFQYNTNMSPSQYRSLV